MTNIRAVTHGNRLLTLLPKDEGEKIVQLHEIAGFVPKGMSDEGYIISYPHSLEAHLKLAQMGVASDHPMTNPQVWKPQGKFEPFDYQIQTGEYITSFDNSWVLNGLGCVDSETEYLTPHGWEKISEYDGGVVAQYNPDTGSAVFVEPSQYIKLPCKDMLRLKSTRGLDQMLSPEHRVLMERKDGVRKVVTAESLYDHQPKEYSIPTAFHLHNETQMDRSDEMIRLMVAVIADGYYTNLNTLRCAVRLKKPRKIERLHRLLNNVGLEYKFHPCKPDGFYIFTFYLRVYEKRFGGHWYDASYYQRRIIIDEVKHWDSNISVRKNTTAIRFSSYIKASAEYIQWCASSIGITASRVDSVRERRGKIETEYLCHIYDRHQRKVTYGTRLTDEGYKKHSNVSRCESTDGFKYCFTVPTGFLVLRRNGCVFLTGNSGKTISCIWAAEFLKSQKLVSTILIVCPLSTVQHVWLRELFQSYPTLRVGVVTGTKKQKLSILQRDYDYYIVNHDGLRQRYILDELKELCPDLVILDEATAMKNGSTSRFNSLEELYNHCGPRLWALTGTPAAHSPTDIYAVQTLINPDTVPSSMTRWKRDTMYQITRYMWKPRPNADKIVESALQPAIRFVRSDIPQLGIPIELHAELTTEQKRIFAKVKEEMMIELSQGGKEHIILAVNAAVMLSKLLQICSGNVYDINRDTVVLENKERLNALLGVMEEGGVEKDTKALVFIPFKSSQHQIMQFLNDKGYKAELVNGDVNSNKRAEIFRRFEEDDDIRVLCLHPRVASHGLTLIRASLTIWYGPQFSTETYLQANARTARIGQNQNLSLVHITSHAVEREVFKNLMDKKDSQDAILKLFDQVIDMDE